MKQKIVIKVSLKCQKCRTKALQIAAVADGVTSVAFHGADKDKLLIQGEGVDAACLTRSLRKKLCHAILETVEEIKPKKEPQYRIACCHQSQPEFITMVPVSDPWPTGGCTIV